MAPFALPCQCIYQGYLQWLEGPRHSNSAEEDDEGELTLALPRGRPFLGQTIKSIDLDIGLSAP